MGSRTLWGTGSEGVGKPGTDDKKPAADAEDGAVPIAPSEPDPSTGIAAIKTTATTDGAAPTGVRATRLTPGGSALAALLTSNRAKASRADGGDGSGPVPRPTRVTPSGGTFDLLDITAVGGAIADKKGDKGEAGEGKGSGPIRPTRLTPASGGLPALLAATGRDAGKPGDDNTRTTPVRPTRTTPATSGFESLDVTAVGGAVVDKGSVSDDRKTDVGGSDAGKDAVATGGAGAKRDPNAPRPTRLTPGSGGLAALLAQTRSRTGKHDILEKKTPIAASDSGAVDGRSAVVRAAEPGAEAADTSQPEKKKSTFAATLMGVPAPEIKVPFPMEVLRQHSPGAASSTPQPVDHGEPTEKNIEVSGDARDSAAFRARAGLDERHRTTEVVDVVRANRGPRLAVGVVVAAAVVLIGIVAIGPRLRKQPGQTSQAPPGAMPTESPPLTAPPTTPPTAADPAAADPNAATAPPEVPTTPKDETTAKASAAEEARDKARAEAKAAKAAKAEAAKQARADAKAAKAAKEEAAKQARAEAKAAKAAKESAKEEAAKQARAEAKAAKAAKESAKAEAQKQAKVAKAGKDETQKAAQAEAKAAKEEAAKQARAEAKAAKAEAKAAKAEAAKQARAEARAAKEARAAREAKDEGPTGTRPGLPWESSSAESTPSVAARPEPRRPANVTEASKPKSSVPARPLEDPDATLPLSTR